MGADFIQDTINEVEKTLDEDVGVPEEETPKGPWNIKNEVNKGGEATIYLIEQNRQDRILKLYYPGKEPSQDLLESVSIFSRESPEHVAQIFEYGIDETRGQCYEIIEYIKNGSLVDWYKENGSFSESFIQNTIPEINTALHDLHSKDILHLDLKPSNILIRKSSPFLDLVLTDFGISTLIHNQSGVTFSVRRGTPTYWAPEQVPEKGAVTKKTDYWAFGMTLLWMITGKNPYSGLSIEAISGSIATESIKIPTDIDERLRNLLRGLLCRNVIGRWGYEEIVEWCNGNNSILICPDLQTICKFDGREYLPKELASVLTNSPENWKKAQSYVGNYLLKCLENTNNHHIADEIRYKLQYEENINVKVIIASVILDKSIPFCYLGLLISSHNLIQIFKKYVRKQSDEIEEELTKDFFNGNLSRAYGHYQTLSDIKNGDAKILDKIFSISETFSKDNKPSIDEVYHIISYSEGLTQVYTKGITFASLSKFLTACKRFNDEETVEFCKTLINNVYYDSDVISDVDHYHLGLFYEEENEEKKANECFKKAVNKNKRNKEAFIRYIINSKKIGMSAEKIDILINIFSKNWPDDTYISMMRAELYLHERKYPEAIQTYYSVIKKDPLNAEAYASKGDVMFQLNEIKRAKLLYEKALKLDNNCTRAKLGQEKILLWEG